jgi:hypothetical protein
LQVREAELEVRGASCPLEPLEATVELLSLVQVSLGARDDWGVLAVGERCASAGFGVSRSPIHSTHAAGCAGFLPGERIETSVRMAF